MVEYLEQPYELIDNPLPWHKAGLSWTASGYGAKIASHRMVRLPNGRKYRVYVTQISNAGSAWITLGGKKLYLRD
jgi:hypothetical protein